MNITFKPVTNASDFRNKVNLLDTKEMTRAWSLIVVGDDFNPRELAAVRCFKSRGASGASPVSCQIYFYGDDYRSGTGKASGCGYHKASAAFQAALESAGIVCDEEPSGDRGIDSALQALARACGYLTISQRLVVTHG